MAEAFGIAAGALTVAGLFNNCVDCFEYVQIARNYGRDFHTCQLRLDFAKDRLSRWGQLVNVNSDPRSSRIRAGDDTESLAAGTLFQILLLFSEATKVVSKFGSPKPEIYDPSADANTSVRNVHTKLHDWARLRQRRTGLLKKVKWALYESKNLDELVRHIHDLVDQLEKLIPENEAREQLPRLVAEEVASFDMNELQVIDENVDNTDQLFRELVKSRIDLLQGYSAGNIKMTENVRIGIGDIYSDTAVTSGYKPGQGPSSSVGNVDATGSSRLHVGTKYGGRSFMED